MFSFAYIINAYLVHIVNYTKVFKHLSKLKKFSNYNYG
jgi:hypothetical protein